MSDIKPEPAPSDDEGNEAFSFNDHRQNEAAPAPDNNEQQQHDAAALSTNNRDNHAAPAPNGDGGNQVQEYINLKIQHDEDAIKYHVKKTITMEKLMKSYAERKNLDPHELRFLFDGERLIPDATPKSLEMEDGDVIEVYIRADGG